MINSLHMPEDAPVTMAIFIIVPFFSIIFAYIFGAESTPIFRM